ncbi:MAG: twin-arginine translocase TatA/TatE family subunit [Bacteroidales bacterium]|nr:twin-arginine translocase TatA/TatE family subunit [Bacteroidales bacterium]
MINNLLIFMNMFVFVPMGVVGPWQVVIIALVIVLLFGGKKIPELMKGIGKGVRSFKEGMNELEKETKEIQRDLESTAKEPDEIRKIDEKK